jgi:cytochrome c biogenesis protein CcmG, thiol:disulfide interchange protein DsbE
MKLLRFVPVLIFFTLAGLFFKGLSLNAREVPSVMIGHKVPHLILPRLDSGALQSFEPIKGKISLINVWASWCEVCNEEQNFLMELAQKGVLIYGLNYKDDPVAAKAWLLRWGNPYQWNVSDQAGRAAIELGVYGAPETFLIDEQGVIRYRHAGALTSEVWQKMQRLS